MGYIVIEVRMRYKENKLSEIAVLWQSNELGWVRASYFTHEHCMGYGYLQPGGSLSAELIQKVAGFGRNLQDNKKSLYFPGKKLWER